MAARDRLLGVDDEHSEYLGEALETQPAASLSDKPPDVALKKLV